MPRACILPPPACVFNSILRFIARHLRGFFAPLAAFVTVGIIVAAVAVGLFSLIAEGVEEGVTQRFDEAVLRWFETHRTPFLDEIMLEITTLGGGVVLIMMVLIAAVFLWQTHHKWSVYLLLLGTLGAKLANSLLKQFFNRERPSVVEGIDAVRSLSFPSGHAMSAMAVYGCVAYLVGRLEPKPALKHLTWGVAAVVILLIGISRMYLGVHYPSDVMAGYLGGLGWIAFIIGTLKAVQFLAARRRPETQAEEQDLQMDSEPSDAIQH
jgi:membrane-associated phospholipid phosphatase